MRLGAVVARGRLADRGRTAGRVRPRLVLGGDAVTKRITVSRSVAARAPLRPRAGMWDEFLNPAESPLSASSRIESIEVRYPPRSLDAFGLSSSWLVVFLVLTTVFMLIGRPLVNVVM